MATLRLICLAILTLAACRAGSERLNAGELAALLRSSDRVAVYTAGMEAYRRKDFADARRLWQRAGDLGDADAVSNLGYLTYFGFGGAADSAAGIFLWREAARRGAPEAHRHLAQAIFEGDTSAGTRLEAYAHARAAQMVAGARGDPASEDVAHDAARLLSRHGPEFSEAERSIADSLAETWARAASAPE